MLQMTKWPQCDPRGSEPRGCHVIAGILANGPSQPVAEALTEGRGLGGRTQLLNSTDYPQPHCVPVNDCTLESEAQPAQSGLIWTIAMCLQR